MHVHYQLTACQHVIHGWIMSTCKIYVYVSAHVHTLFTMPAQSTENLCASGS